MMNKSLKLAILAVLATGATASWGQSAGSPKTSTFDVTARVNNACTITAGNTVAFGTYDPVAAAQQDATNTFSVTCTKGATDAAGGGGTGALAPVITLNAGQHAALATSTTRAMKNANNTDAIDYDVYMPGQTTAPNSNYDTCPYSAVWTPTTGSITPAASFWTGAAKSFNICGRIPAGQSATAISVGAYSDTLTVTVQF